MATRRSLRPLILMTYVTFIAYASTFAVLYLTGGLLDWPVQRWLAFAPVLGALFAGTVILSAAAKRVVYLNEYDDGADGGTSRKGLAILIALPIVAFGAVTILLVLLHTSQTWHLMP